MPDPLPNGRDGRGRFAAGNTGGPGNPLARNIHHYRKLLLDAVTDAQFIEVVQKLVADAIAGDKDARELLINRLCGKAEVIESAEPSMFEERVIRVRPVKVALPPGAIPTKPEDMENIQ